MKIPENKYQVKIDVFNSKSSFLHIFCTLPTMMCESAPERLGVPTKHFSGAPEECPKEFKDDLEVSILVARPPYLELCLWECTECTVAVVRNGVAREWMCGQCPETQFKLDMGDVSSSKLQTVTCVWCTETSDFMPSDILHSHGFQCRGCAWPSPFIIHSLP
jgi:hypothetical protein